MIYRAIYKKANFTTMESEYTYSQIIQDIKSIDITEKQLRNDIKALIELEVLQVVKKGTKGKPTIYKITILEKIRALNGQIKGTNGAQINKVLQQLGELEDTNKALNRHLKGDPIKEKEKDNIYSAYCDKLWSLYPRKKGKQNAYKKIPKLIDKYTYEQIERCINRYKAELEEDRTDIRFIKTGETFFNSGYVDYLDINYQEQHRSNVVDVEFGKSKIDYESMTPEQIMELGRRK